MDYLVNEKQTARIFFAAGKTGILLNHGKNFEYARAAPSSQLNLIKPFPPWYITCVSWYLLGNTAAEYEHKEEFRTKFLWLVGGINSNGNFKIQK